MDDYKGLKRFSHELSKKINAWAMRFFVFLSASVVTFVIVFSLVGNSAKTNNAGVYAFSSLLVFMEKKEMKLAYIDDQGDRVTFDAGQYQALPVLKNSLNYVGKLALMSAALSVFSGGLVLALFIRFFSGVKKKRNLNKEHIRGAKKVEAEDLAAMINKEKLGTPYQLGNVPWIKETVDTHAYFSGDTGRGKSQILMDQLDVIRARGEKAFILDKNGEMMSHYYDPEKDYVLGPFDDRSKFW